MMNFRTSTIVLSLAGARPPLLAGTAPTAGTAQRSEPAAGRNALIFLNGEPQLKWARAQFGV